MSDETTVSRNDERHRFEIHTDDGRLAGFAEYRAGEGVREFTHTVVKDEFEGQGVGSKLARAALDQTRGEGLSVVPTCQFIKGWIDKHPDYQDLVA
ncbi:MAG TPA: GNAT family N-acetyltransferase [Nocardioides sp.]|nr:GNAT family N-acetyltransferase [Nocardioides sp.]